MIRKRTLGPLLVFLLVLWNAPVANARLVARTALVTNGVGVTKIVLKLSSTNPVTRRSRPTGVKVVAGGQTYQLTRVTSVATTSTRLGTWKSAGYNGAERGALFELVGDQVTVKVSSRSGTASFRSNLTSRDSYGPAAIDRMTELFSGAGFGDYSSSGSERYELHLCTDGWARYFHSFNSEFGSVTTEKFGQPWSISSALISADESYAAAFVEVTFTLRNDSGEGGSETNEHWETLLEFSGGSWYWAGDVAETFQASCDPTF